MRAVGVEESLGVQRDVIVYDTMLVKSAHGLCVGERRYREGGKEQ